MDDAKKETSTAAGLPDDFDARMRSSCMDLEPDIHDLHHMAAVAWTLFQDTIKGPASGTGWRSAQMTEHEFELLEFAISKTTLMASDLRDTYMKAIGGPGS